MGFEEWPFIGTRGKRLRRLLAQEARPALERIRRDRAQPQLLYPMHDAFDFLAAQLFSSELSVERLFGSTRVQGSKAFQSFQAITGVTPRAYIEERRLETAAGLLLADKSLAIEVIAAVIGYRTPGGFRRAFQRWAGQPPGDFRRNILKHKLRGGRGPQPAWFAGDWVASFRAGTLEPVDRQAAIEWLRACGARPGGGAELARVEIEAFERGFGRAWWQLLRRLPVADQRSLWRQRRSRRRCFSSICASKAAKKGATTANVVCSWPSWRRRRSCRWRSTCPSRR
ncbi:MAG: AraC family transcriptional regulator [Thermoanaerobaculia bacterium]|nr:AraC family transcriptional regulator [Thermoanaerobaculia bacterium]